MKETIYKDRKIKALSYQLGEGAWVPRVEIQANLPGAKNSHTVNGMTALPTQEAADNAALEMGQSWTDAHNRPAVKRPRSMSGFGHHHLNGKSGGVKRPAKAEAAATGNGKTDGSGGQKAETNNGKSNGKTPHDHGKQAA
jgi:hypothetical protein